MRTILENDSLELLNEIREFGEIKTLNESGFSRLMHIFYGQVDSVVSVGIITAENPQNKKLSDYENKALITELKKDLKNSNLGFVQIKGKYGNFENPLVVMNISRELIIKYGLKYSQQSVIWGSKNENNNDLGFTFEMIEGNQTTQERYVSLTGKDIYDLDDNYSEIKGRRFVIPFFDDEFEKKEVLRGKIQDKNGNEISEQAYDYIIKKTNILIMENVSGKAVWESNGCLKNELSKNNANIFDKQDIDF